MQGKPQIVEVNDKSIIVKGLSMKDDGGIIQKIMDICHRTKHLYKDGYECGHKTRSKTGKRHAYWEDCPHICIVYLITNDMDYETGFKKDPNVPYLKICTVISELDDLKKRLTDREISLIRQMFISEISEKVEALLF